MIQDFGSPRSNVASCMISLQFYGSRIAEDPSACKILLETISGCGEAWAQEMLAKCICLHVSAFLLRPWSVSVLDVALCYSEELCIEVHSALLQESRLFFVKMQDDETIYRLSLMSMRMVGQAAVIPDLGGIHEILATLSLRLGQAADRQITCAWMAMYTARGPRVCERSLKEESSLA